MPCLPLVSNLIGGSSTGSARYTVGLPGEIDAVLALLASPILVDSLE